MDTRRLMRLLLLAVVAPLALAAPAHAAAGPVAAYGFEESNSSVVQDTSGNGNNGSLSGATRTLSGKYGSALQFNGTSASVIVPDSAS